MKRLYKNYVKRVLDFIFALILSVLSLPFLLLGIVIMKVDSNGPIFFTQKRIGYLSQPFKIYKLRTMILETHRNGIKLRDRDRVTRAGKVIRKLSIDEIPQLYNVLLGEMSFIGPRPLLPRYLPYYTDKEIERHNVRPGITGLAQIHGRSNLQWEERFSYDLFYVKNVSFRLDLKILFKTVIKVLKSDDTSTIRPANLVDFDEHRNYKKLR